MAMPLEIPTIHLETASNDLSTRTLGSSSVTSGASSVDKEVYVFPTSFAQQGFLLLEELAPGNPAFIMALNLQLTGNLNVPVLEDAINEMIDRHEILRTTFMTLGGQKVQVVAPQRSVKLPVIDLSAVDAKERNAKSEQVIRKEALSSFDLARGPLIRFCLVRLGVSDHILLVTIHHIIGDGWSNGIIVRDLAQLYTSLVQNKPSNLPQLSLQFADYAAWEQTQSESAAFTQDLAYWLKLVGENIAAIDFPTDRPRTDGRGFRSEQAIFPLSNSLVGDLKVYCNRKNVTLYMVFLAAFEIMLHRYSGQTDILVGTPAANRMPQTEDLVGPFANMVVVRNDLGETQRFRVC